MGTLGIKSATNLAFAFTVAMTGSASAADLAAPVSPFDFYAGVFGGALFADRDVTGGPIQLSESSEDTFGTIGGLAGFNLHNGSFFYGLEGDIGFVFGDAGDPPLFCGQAWCDADWKAHVRGRVGISTGQFDIFVAGGLAIADLGGSVSSQTVTGFTVGGGVESDISEALSARVEILYDEFENNLDLPSPATPYQGKWSDVAVRGAILFKF